MKKRLKFILNPVSGHGILNGRFETLAKYFNNQNYHIDLFKTKGKGDAKNFAENTGCETSAVVAIGGDGTINEVINGLYGKNVPLGIIPCGTNNLLAKELGIPHNIKKACHIISTGKTKHIDLGYDFKRYFFLMAGIGIDAEVVNHVDSCRKGNITLATYAVPIAKTIASYKLPKILVEVDGKLVTKNATFLFVSNVKGYYGPVRFTYLAKVNDGKFDICIMKAKKKLDILKYIFGATTRTLRNFSDIIYLRGKDVKISSKSNVFYQLDGDPGGNLPARFRIIPKAIRILIP